MHPLCDGLGFGDACCEEGLWSCKDIAAYWEGYAADSDFIQRRLPHIAQVDGHCREKLCRQ